MPNKGTSEAARLREILSAVYERRKDEARVSPSWLATEAMTELDPDREAPPLVYLGCHLELRQIAREFCRKRFGRKMMGRRMIFSPIYRPAIQRRAHPRMTPNM